MRFVVATYATPEYEPYATLLAASARRAGCDDVLTFTPSDLPTDFVAGHEDILKEPRGAGYWLWKPWAVRTALSLVDEGDIVIWADAGMHFAGPATLVGELMDDESLDMWLMGEGFTEGQYTKRDAFVLLDADTEEWRSSPQRFASSFAVTRAPSSEELIDDWLAAAGDRRILTDDPNSCGRPDHPEFLEHRHDQSILSLLTKKAGISVVASGLVAEGLSGPAGQMLNHTRAHQSPSSVAAHLLASGLVTPGDLADLRLR